ncbi:hypothetical protein [Litorisediminicola beolgyonensis]|uniref:Uncharacterized protein n=1 Tax=Litorisediminicola beolgyonensis TaxID=1173614 RepID=A0ABW3ZI62_9RHOB
MPFRFFSWNSAPTPVSNGPVAQSGDAIDESFSNAADGLGDGFLGKTIGSLLTMTGETASDSAWTMQGMLNGETGLLEGTSDLATSVPRQITDTANDQLNAQDGLGQQLMDALTLSDDDDHDAYAEDDEDDADIDHGELIIS